MRPRVIPTLLLDGQGLVKTVQFRQPTYVGDPINAVRVFNEKEVDELIVLDISVSKRAPNEPNLALLANIASEAFMPMAYGGGIASLASARRIFDIGFEKVVLNSLLLDDGAGVEAIVREYGSASVVASVDAVPAPCGGYLVYEHRTGKAKQPLIEHVRRILAYGVGELFVTAVHREGGMLGYDYDLIRNLSSQVNVPLIACGGAGRTSHFRDAIAAGACAVAAGSMFVFYGRYRAVLLQYPEQSEIDALFA
jgi:imidazole glycerol-phosphate synthase subunit HisF